MGRLASKAPVVAVVLAGIVAIGIIDNDYLVNTDCRYCFGSIYDLSATGLSKTESDRIWRKKCPGGRNAESIERD
jgi:hypothetical protein